MSQDYILLNKTLQFGIVLFHRKAKSRRFRRLRFQ